MNVPHLKIYAADGLTLVYTVPALQSINIPRIAKKSTVVESLRGVGGIVIPGSDAVWDLIATFIFLGEGYETVAGLINTLESTVVMHTPYVVTFEKSPSQTYSYNVKMIDPIEYKDSFRVNSQEVTLKFKANTW